MPDAALVPVRVGGVCVSVAGPHSQLHRVTGASGQLGGIPPPSKGGSLGTRIWWPSAESHFVARGRSRFVARESAGFSFCPGSDRSSP